MNAKVLLIQSIPGTQEFQVSMSVGQELQEFMFTVETSVSEPFAVVGGDRKFGQFFRFNQHIATQVGQLVADVYYQKTIDVPIDVGYFLTPEEAIAQQPPFPEPLSFSHP